MNSEWYRSIGIAVTILTGVLFLGILKVFFNIEPNTNILQTGITFGHVFGALQLFLAWALFKKQL
jgi:hypothetical protein